MNQAGDPWLGAASGSCCRSGCSASMATCGSTRRLHKCRCRTQCVDPLAPPFFPFPLLQVHHGQGPPCERPLACAHPGIPAPLTPSMSQHCADIQVSAATPLPHKRSHVHTWPADAGARHLLQGALRLTCNPVTACSAMHAQQQTCSTCVRGSMHPGAEAAAVCLSQ